MSFNILYCWSPLLTKPWGEWAPWRSLACRECARSPRQQPGNIISETTWGQLVYGIGSIKVTVDTVPCTCFYTQVPLVQAFLFASGYLETDTCGLFILTYYPHGLLLLTTSCMFPLWLNFIGLEVWSCSCRPWTVGSKKPWTLTINLLFTISFSQYIWLLVGTLLQAAGNHSVVSLI